MMMVNGHELGDFTFQFIYPNCSVYLTQNMSLRIIILCTLKLCFLWKLNIYFLTLTRTVFVNMSYYKNVWFPIIFSNDGESGGGDDDDDCNNLFYINHKYLLHVHYMHSDEFCCFKMNWTLVLRKHIK